MKENLLTEKNKPQLPDQKNTPEVKLLRVLSLRDLVIYGIILIQPVAALPLFGHANNISKGHAVTTILIAMIAMILTAISYGRMANRYPSAGSAYTYVGKGIHPYLGFVAGWSHVYGLYVLYPSFASFLRVLQQTTMLPFIPFHFLDIFSLLLVLPF